MSFHCDSLVLVLFCLCVCFLCVFFVFWLWFCCLLRVFGCCVFLFSPWNHIISVHHEPEAYYSIGFYCRIHTASKYLHNDLARAIKALEQKKILRVQLCTCYAVIFPQKYGFPYLQSIFHGRNCDGNTPRRQPIATAA